MARILVVDDQKISRVALAAMLTQAGSEVVTAASGPEGIEQAATWGPDVIVLDVHMPDMNGLEVVARLKADPRTVAIPVVFLTGEPPTDDLIVRGLELGAYDFLSKGCSRAEILARVGVMSRIKRDHDELSAIARLSDALIRAGEPDELAEICVDRLGATFRAGATLLIVPTGDDGVRASTGLDGPDAPRRVAARLRTLMHERGEDAVLLDPAELGAAGSELLEPAGFGTGVATRIGRGDETAAALVACFRRLDDGAFTDRDASLLHLLARQATIAIDRALLLRRLREQATELERLMEMRSRFFASLSHELRTPINAVMGYNALLEQEVFGPLQPEQIQTVRKVGRSANHLLELINDVLDLSKIEAGKMAIHKQTTDVADLLRDTVTSVELQAREKDLVLRVEAPDELVLETDPARVRQILLNLLSNAVKFTDQGEVAVRMHLVDEAGRMSCEETEHCWVEILVADTGPGIEPEDRTRIFEEFEQAAGSVNRGGTGLGLPISRRLARLLGGDLRLLTSGPEGSVFALRLPFVVSEPVVPQIGD